MNESESERELATLEWLRKNMPVIASAMALTTFVIIFLAGYDYGKAVLVAVIMFAFVAITTKVREWFGVSGAIGVMLGMALLLWLVQRWGLL